MVLLRIKFIDLNLRDEKWFISCSYNPNKTMISSHTDALTHSFPMHPFNRKVF